jgi:hypothetical protein
MDSAILSVPLVAAQHINTAAGYHGFNHVEVAVHARLEANTVQTKCPIAFPPIQRVALRQRSRKAAVQR